MKTVTYIIIVLAALLSSCKKIIDVDLNDDESKRVVVDAVFTTMQKKHVVKLNLTANYFSADITPQISGATVNISDGTTTYPFTETSPGIYESAATASAKPNASHTLTIDYDGKTYTSTNYCDSVPPLDSINVVLDIISDEYQILFSTHEKPGYGDYYAWQIFINGTLYNDTITEQLANGDNYLPDGTVFVQFPLTTIVKEELNSGDVVTVAQHAISKETYDAYQAILFQTVFRGGIFDTPPADVPTNMSEGAVGIFSVSGETIKSGIVP